MYVHETVLNFSTINKDRQKASFLSTCYFGRDTMLVLNWSQRKDKFSYTHPPQGSKRSCVTHACSQGLRPSIISLIHIHTLCPSSKEQVTTQAAIIPPLIHWGFFLFVPFRSTLVPNHSSIYSVPYTSPLYLTLPFPHIPFSSHSTSSCHDPFTFILVSHSHPHSPHHLQSVSLC